MKSNLDKIAVDLYKKIQTRFNNIKIADEYAEVLSRKDDIPKARFFEFMYIKHHKLLGTIAISLDEDDGLTVQISGNLDKNDSFDDEDYEFIRSFRQFAKRRLIKFNIRNIGKRNLDKRDYTFQAKRKEYIPMTPVMENKLYGSNKISYQDLGEARIVIKHNQPVDVTYPASRTQHIQGIYIENSQGERFKYPLKHLNGARALAEHIRNGGNPYDNIGKHIVGLSEELAHLRKFKNYVNRQEQITESMGFISDRVMERIENIKKEILSLQRPSYYSTFVESFEEQESKIIPEEIVNDWVDRLTIRTFNEELKGVFPYLYNIIDESELPIKILNPNDLLGEDSVDEEYNFRKLGRASIDWGNYADPDVRKRLEQLHMKIGNKWKARTGLKFTLPLSLNKDDPTDTRVQAHFFDQMNDPKRFGSEEGVIQVMEAMIKNKQVLNIIREMPDENSIGTSTGALIFGYEEIDPADKDNKDLNMFIPVTRIPQNRKNPEKEYTYNTFIRGGYHKDDRPTRDPIVWVNIKPNQAIWERPPAWAISKNLVDGVKSNIDAEKIAEKNKDIQQFSSDRAEAALKRQQDIDKPKEIKFQKPVKPEQEKTGLPSEPASKSVDTPPEKSPEVTDTSSNKKSDPYAGLDLSSFVKPQIRRSKRRVREDIESVFESFIESLVSNTGIFSQDPEIKRNAIDKLNELLAKEFLAGPDGINARDSLIGIIDDQYFLDSLRDMGDLDIRSLIKDYVTKKDPNLVYELNFGEEEPEISTETPPSTEPAPSEETPPESEIPPEGGMPAAPGAPAVPPTPVGGMPAPGEETLPLGGTAPAPMAEAFNSFGRDFKSKTRPKFTFSNRRRLGMRNLIRRAQRAGATLETTLNVGNQNYTIEDIIDECGFSFEECGFENNKNGVQEVIDSIIGFWNNEEGNFTKGGEGVKTIIIKKFKDGEYKHATEDDINHVLELIDQKDPSGNHHNQISRIKDLAGIPKQDSFLAKFVSDKESELEEVVSSMQESAIDHIKKIITNLEK